MSPRRLLMTALCLIVGVTGAGATWAAFSSTTAELRQLGGHRAATFGHARVATGTYTGNNTDNRNIAVGFAPQVVIVKGDCHADRGRAQPHDERRSSASRWPAPPRSPTNSIQNLTGQPAFRSGRNAQREHDRPALRLGGLRGRRRA